MDNKKKKEDKEERKVSEKEIDDKLSEMCSSEDSKTRFFAKILFNLRFDLNELKQELIKTFTGEDGHFEIEIAIPEQMKKDLRRLSDDYFS